MLKPQKIGVALTILNTAFAPTAIANEGRITVGLGVSTSSELYIGDGSDLGAFPYIAYDNGNLHLGIDGARYTVLEANRLSFSVGLAPRFDPDFPDTAVFFGLNRDFTVEGVLSATYTIDDTFQVSTSFQHDLLSEHEGFEAQVMLRASQTSGLLRYGASVGARHRSGDLNHYLVGVSAFEANGQRQAYYPGRSTSPFIGLDLTFPLSQRAAFFAGVDVYFLGDTYKDSPLVSKSTQSSARFGLGYTF